MAAPWEIREAERRARMKRQQTIVSVVVGAIGLGIVAAVFAALLFGNLWMRNNLPCWALSLRDLPASRIAECTGLGE